MGTYVLNTELVLIAVFDADPGQENGTKVQLSWPKLLQERTTRLPLVHERDQHRFSYQESCRVGTLADIPAHLLYREHLF